MKQRSRLWASGRTWRVALALSSAGLLMASAAPAQAASTSIADVATTINGTTVSATAHSAAGTSVWYQFRATDTATGHTWILRKFDRTPTVNWVPPVGGVTYDVQAFALTQSQVIHHQWRAAVPGRMAVDRIPVAQPNPYAGRPGGGPTLPVNLAPNAVQLSVASAMGSGYDWANWGIPHPGDERGTTIGLTMPENWRITTLQATYPVTAIGRVLTLPHQTETITWSHDGSGMTLTADDTPLLPPPAAGALPYWTTPPGNTNLPTGSRIRTAIEVKANRMIEEIYVPVDADTNLTPQIWITVWVPSSSARHLWVLSQVVDSIMFYPQP
ncbi:MAG: hypothetical protein C7B45_11910 [Sulfobacillus acidophilus]|uniref:Fibronectin type-III domain-containing protein n=1 Tax=Sulfobacillus acidophilus TaxID=53633 RepID=A0A2T2WG24_9FIRM|nr:MAG: hypothetical protein C7B45_11910 [Sulfobacillus acidophilus]